MKKVSIILLALMLAMAFSSCSKEENGTNSNVNGSAFDSANVNEKQIQQKAELKDPETAVTDSNLISDANKILTTTSSSDSVTDEEPAKTSGSDSVTDEEPAKTSESDSVTDKEPATTSAPNSVIGKDSITSSSSYTTSKEVTTKQTTKTTTKSTTKATTKQTTKVTTKSTTVKTKESFPPEPEEMPEYLLNFSKYWILPEKVQYENGEAITAAHLVLQSLGIPISKQSDIYKSFTALGKEGVEGMNELINYKYSFNSINSKIIDFDDLKTYYDMDYIPIIWLKDGRTVVLTNLDSKNIIVSDPTEMFVLEYTLDYIKNNQCGIIVVGFN